MDIFHVLIFSSRSNAAFYLWIRLIPSRLIVFNDPLISLPTVSSAKELVRNLLYVHWAQSVGTHDLGANRVYPEYSLPT
jgi:hypothetical protein